MPDYLKEAFLFRWNLLFFLGGAAAAALTPLAGVLLPLVAAGELTYLAGLVSIPRFRAAIDAKVHAAGNGRRRRAARRRRRRCRSSRMLAGLPADARTRFERLHARCVEMRTIAAGVRGAAGERQQRPRRSARRASIGCCGCSCACWSRRRRSTGSCRRSNEQEIFDAARRAAQEPRGRAGDAGDERIVRSLQDSIAMASCASTTTSARRRTRSSSSIELDRIEGKIQALAEMASTGRIRTSSAARSIRRPTACGKPRKRSANCNTSPAWPTSSRNRRPSSKPTCARCCAQDARENVA